jgi:hypothetical protein
MGGDRGFSGRKKEKSCLITNLETKKSLFRGKKIR